jgi:hypothetical protein
MVMRGLAGYGWARCGASVIGTALHGKARPGMGASIGRIGRWVLFSWRGKVWQGKVRLVGDWQGLVFISLLTFLIRSA